MKSVYLSGRLSRRSQLGEYGCQLEALGIEVTSRWLRVGPPDGLDEMSDDQWSALALVDVEDVQRADGLIFFSEEHEGGGGRHVELGLALAWSKDVIVVGQREHIFHRLPQVRVVSDWDQALLIIKAARGGVQMEASSRPA